MLCSRAVMIQSGIALLLLGVLLTGCQEKSAPAPSAAPAVPVGVVEISPQPITLTTALPGRVASLRVAEIRPQVSGLLLRRLFTEGRDVEKGQELYTIDPAPFEAQLDNALAGLAKAEANMSAVEARAKRFAELLPEKAISQQDYDDAVSALRQAQAEIELWKAQVKSARIDLDYTSIKAPISGRIGRSHVTEGSIVTAYQGTALATIQQLDPVYIDVAQSTTEVLRLRRLFSKERLKTDPQAQNKVAVVLEDGTPYCRTGVLQFSEVTVDQTTGSVILRIEVTNPDGVLLPGMFVRAVLTEGVSPEAILVPQQAVSRDPKGNPVTLVVNDDNVVEQRLLTIDRAIDNLWLVSSGLHQGDRVVVDGLQKIRAGSKVTVASTLPSPVVTDGQEQPTAEPADK